MISSKSGTKDWAFVGKDKKNQLTNQPFQLKVMMGADNRQEISELLSCSGIFTMPRNVQQTWVFAGVFAV